MRLLTTILFWLIAYCLVVDVSLAAPLPQTILVIDQSDPSSPVSRPIRTAFRSALNMNAFAVYTTYYESLDIQRFGNEKYFGITRNYFDEKYRGKQIDLIVVFGRSALDFTLTYRSSLWPSAPIVFGLIDHANIEHLMLPSNVTGVTIDRNFEMAVTAAKLFVPDLKRLVLVGGLYEDDVNRIHYKNNQTSDTPQLEIIDLTGLPLAEVRSRVIGLPDDSALFYTALYKDLSGKQYVPEDVLAAITKMTNRPIVIDSEILIADGVSGGYVLIPETVGNEVGSLALRVLTGESASAIPVIAGNNVKPIFNSHELQKWNVNIRDLPTGSEVRFHQPGAWELYSREIISALLIIVILVAMIGALVFEHRRRNFAEEESKGRLQQVIHMDRTLIAGAMSASIAHELNQPLGAILANTETAQVLLNSQQVDLALLKEILVDIERDDKRAANIIGHLRGLLKKRSGSDVQVADINETIEEAIAIIGPDMKRRKFTLTSAQEQCKLPVRADHVHLQQVIINLLMNGMDAMNSSPNNNRDIVIKTAMIKNTEVEVSVADSGRGIPSGMEHAVFDAFFTTKPDGTGLGLAIARTIIENYGGHIWAENQPSGSAVFRFNLPLV
jgi:signal transduction histidine kinase